MCLEVNDKYHNKIFGIRIPRIAEHDILTIKALCYDHRYRYITPVMETPVHFSNGICKMHVRWFSKDSAGYINKGIHSYRTGCFSIKNHLAIIPKGTLYYVGSNNDIVSLNLIVFESYSNYKDYCKLYDIEPTPFEQHTIKISLE